MAEQDTFNSNDRINQSVLGDYNQVAGRDIIIHATSGQDDKPAPDNPNLISCPACNKYGVFRGADECPSCNYSFLNNRLAAEAAARSVRDKGRVILSFLALGTLLIAMWIATEFQISLSKGLVCGAMIALLIYSGGLWLLVKFNTWNKFRHDK
ncbi:MAG TPA: hypothetical protein VGJ93_15625 [Desulfuromonadaceae bacterium]|jgi:hypothetical protein